MNDTSIKSLDFNNTAIAFRNLSTPRLKAAYRLFQLFQFPLLVKLGPWLTYLALKLRLPLGKWLARGVFSHFAGGDSIEHCLPKVEELSRSGVGTILDFATEHLESKSDFKRTLEETSRNIEFASQHDSIPFCVFKPSGLARFALLEKVSGRQALSSNERQEWEESRARFFRVGKLAAEKKVALLVDAEETWIQDAIDEVVLAMMREFNRGDKPIVYNTVQMYRHDRLSYMERLLALANQEGFKIGLKIVRGAYLEKERARAKKMRYPSPIYPTKEDTDRAYNEAVSFSIGALDKISLCIGTHNEYSTQLAARLMDQYQIDRKDQRLNFSQLLGMSDNLTFNLAYWGYQVSKYVPYGKLEDLLPYLTRRAQENSSIQGQSGRELSLIKKELHRRIQESH